MKRYLFANLFSLLCVIAAACLAAAGADGWGWFLFVGVITLS